MELRKGDLNFEKEDQLLNIIQNQENLYTQRVSEEEDHNLSVEDIQILRRRLTGEIDFSVPEIALLKKELFLSQTSEVFNLFREYPSLLEVPIYKLFGLYLSVWHCNRVIFNYIRSNQSQLEEDLHVLDQEALNLVEKHNFEEFQGDAEDCKTLLTELVVYRALDFNIREIFSHGLQKNAQIKLRRTDALILIKYRHYQEMILTFNKPIRRGLVKIFYDKELLISEEQYYTRYCLSFYMELMLAECYSDQEVLGFIGKMREFFDVDQAMHVFIRLDKLDLLRWGETQDNFCFRMQYLGLAINYEAFDIVLHYLMKYSDFIKKNQCEIPSFTLQSFQRSNSLFLDKILLVQKYFKAFSVEHLHEILNILQTKYSSSVAVGNPFMYTLNPIVLGLVQIRIFRQIGKKFKSLEVKCIELEDYIERSLLAFLDEIRDINIIWQMMQQEIEDRVYALSLMSELSLYKIIQHRNVQEVLFTIYKSEYSIEAWPIEEFSLIEMAFHDSVFSEVDIESKYRFQQLNLDTDQAKQNSLMFHIWKKSTFIRYNIEFFSITLYALIFQACLVSFTTYSSLPLGSFQALVLFEEEGLFGLAENDVFSSSVVYYHCNQVEQYLGSITTSLTLVQVQFYVQVFFLYKMMLDTRFLVRTKRKGKFLNANNVVMGLLGCIALVYSAYQNLMPEFDPTMAYACRTFGGYSQKSVDQLAFLTEAWNKDDFLTSLFAVDTVLMWALIIMQLRLVQQVGTLLKIIIRMFQDFLKVFAIYMTVMVIFFLVGYTLFFVFPEFSNFTRVIQLLFDAGTGEFDLNMFQEMPMDIGMIDFFIDISVMGKIFLIVYVILQNIMMLNLMIALFSDSYSKLLKIGEGLYLKEIIEMIPSKHYDEYYSGLVSCPFPLSILLAPLSFGYIFIKSKKYNETVLRIAHGVTCVFLILPFSLLTLFLILPFVYVKAILNKGFLIFKSNSRSQLAQRLLSFLLFLPLGPLILLLNTLIELVQQFKIIDKSEDKLSLRNEQPAVTVCSGEISKLKDFCFSSSFCEKMQTRNVVGMVSERMEISKKISQLALGTNDEVEIISYLKSFSRVKQFFVDSSILEQGELFIYPQMLRAIIRDIELQLQNKEILEREKEEKQQSTGSKYDQKNFQGIQNTKDMQRLLFMSRVGIASVTFARKKSLDNEEQTLTLLNESMEKSIAHVDKFVQKNKQKVLEYMR